jgi:hypothetical protein
MHLRIILVGLFFGLMLLNFGVHSYHDVSQTLESSAGGWTLVPSNMHVRVTPGLSSADTSSLQDDDEVVALDGEQITDELQLSIALEKMLARLPPESTYTLAVRRKGQIQQLTLRTGYVPLWPKILVIVHWLPLAIFPLTGLVVFWLKPDNKQALLLALMLGPCWRLGISPKEMLTVIFLNDQQWLVGLLILALIVGSTFPAVILHFFLVFPGPSPLLRRWPRLEYWIYLPYLAIAPFLAVEYIARAVTSDHSFLGLPEKVLVPLLLGSVGATFFLYVLGGLLSLVFNYRRADRLAQRKLRVVLVGTLAGLLPGLLFALGLVAFNPSFTPLLRLLHFAAFSMLPIIPISFAYAIVRHQVIPVSLIIRRGIQYLLAKNAMRVVIGLGGVVDERSDLFSLGVITVELLTGQRPFKGNTYHELLTSILNHPLTLEGDAGKAVALNTALQKSLAKDAADRFASAAEMRDKIVPAIRQFAQVVETKDSGLEDETIVLQDTDRKSQH